MATPSSAQLDLELETVLSHSVFPGRSSLRIAEVARALDVDDQHVLNLIEEGRLGAIDVRNGDLRPTKPGEIPRGSRRRWLRIPVSAYDAFIRSRSTLAHQS